MIKLLLGGSPCTYWSIAQKNRETEPSGMGWDLFENYLIVLEKFKPDYFLYENNKSMSKAIKEEITRRFGFEPICINSSLVSAQNRQRLYWCGKRNIDGTYSRVDVEKPEDRKILLKDILETGECWQEKSYCITATEYKGGNLKRTIEKHRRTMVAEPVAIGSRTYPRIPNGELRTKRLEAREDEKANFLTTVTTDSMVAIPSDKPVYEVKNGMITTKDKIYPIKLKDGYYIVRKLTPIECERLQTMPDGYTAAVSNTQRYKGLGNGWTAEVIIHILNGALKDVPRNIPIKVLSMYDGIGTGRYCLDKMGFTNVEYHAYEIDKYAMKIAMSNYPDIIQHGDAFQIREKTEFIL